MYDDGMILEQAVDYDNTGWKQHATVIEAVQWQYHTKEYAMWVELLELQVVVPACILPGHWLYQDQMESKQTKSRSIFVVLGIA